MENYAVYVLSCDVQTAAPPSLNCPLFPIIISHNAHLGRAIDQTVSINTSPLFKSLN